MSVLGRQLEHAATSDASNAGARFDELQFDLRLTLITVLSLVCVFVPQIGDRRLLLAGILAGIVFPAHLITRRVMRVPNPTGQVDLLAVLAAATVAVIDPALFGPALLFQMLNVAGSVAFLNPRWTSILGAATLATMVPVAVLRPVDPDVWLMVGVAVVFLPALILGASQKKAKEGRASQRVASIVSSLPVLLWEADRDSSSMRAIIGQPARVLGTSAQQLLGSGYASQIHPDDRESFDARLTSGGTEPLTYRFRRADGVIRWLSDRIEDVDTGAERLVRGVRYDVTSERQARDTVVRQSEIVERMSAVTIVVDDPELGSGAEVLLATDPVGDLSIQPRAVIGKSFGDAFPYLIEHHWLSEGLKKVSRLSTIHSGPHEIVSPIDEQLYVELQLFSLPDGSAALILENVTEREETQRLIRYQASHDSLTDLPNRALLLETLADRLRDNQAFALALIDLNRFKNINDTLGHFTGDELLRVLAKRLSNAIGPDDIVARLGGDEFAVVLSDTDRGELQHRLERIVQACREKATVAGSVVAAGASVGVTLAPHHSDDPHTLLRFADIAMYEAKRASNSVRYYEPGRTNVPEHLDLMADLGSAFTLGQFVPYFQPKIDVATGETTGAEALARWLHPDRGLLMPADFLELVMLAGQVDDLMRQILWATANTLARLPDHMGLALNLSAVNLRRSDLAEIFADVLDAHDLDPGRLTVELTESELMDETGVLHRSLHDLAELGLGVSVDDFGTGYSSLSHLRSLPLTELKVDQRFVGGLTANHHDQVIVRTLIDLGHNLGLTVTAEGVADHATLDALRQLGCDKAQGFLLSEAVPADDFVELATSTARLFDSP